MLSAGHRIGSSCCSKNGYIYIFGGFNGSEHTNDFYEFQYKIDEALYLPADQEVSISEDFTIFFKRKQDD